MNDGVIRVLSEYLGDPTYSRPFNRVVIDAAMKYLNVTTFTSFNDVVRQAANTYAGTSYADTGTAVVKALQLYTGQPTLYNLNDLINLAAPTMGVGGFSLAAFMAAQADGFWYEFSRIDLLSQDTAGATPVAAPNDVIGRVVDRRTGANSPRNATQATASLKPKFQTTGAAFDGSNDNLLTGYNAGVGANFIVAKVIVPASISAVQIVAGAAIGPSDRFYLSLDNTTGRVSGGAGNQSPGSLSGLTDLRGTTTVIGISCGAGVARLFAGTALEKELAFTGAQTQSAPFRIGAGNTGGTATNFFGGSIKAIVAGREFIDLTRFNQIAAAL